MHRRPILWPLDITHSGYVYGWTHPILCVAGVLQAESRDEAESRLQRAVSGTTWSTTHRGSVSCPVLLGHCTHVDVAQGLPSPDFVLYDAPLPYEDGYLLVYYQRFRRESMRFYTLDSRDLDILPYHDIPEASAHPKVNDAFLKQDFTRPNYNALPSVDSTVVAQLNIARTLADIVEKCNVTDRFTPNKYRESSNKYVPPPRSRQSADNTEHTSIFARIRNLLRDNSAVVEQFDVRYEQGCFVLAESTTVYNNRHARSADAISRYVKFYNCIWLVLNDIIIGVAFGSFFCENHEYLGTLLDSSLQYYMVKCMQEALLWLNNWPAGLKLNTELSQFYCNTLLGIISLWSQILQFAAPYFPALVWVVGAMGYCGTTMIISLLSDILSLLTIHLYLCYRLSTLAFSQQSSLAGSLWNLFRGKRYNVLRNRLDSWDYDLDQLLLGTILFTLVAFLYPTVLTYYAFFAMTRVMIIAVHAALDTASALLNHFPLFALMLRVKDPMRLPGRATFRHSHAANGALILKNEPAPLASIFKHYAHLGRRLWSHYHPLRILRQLTAGQDLRPIPRSSIRYNMISSKRNSATMNEPKKYGKIP